MTDKIPQEDRRLAKGAFLSRLGPEGLNHTAAIKILVAFTKTHTRKKGASAVINIPAHSGKVQSQCTEGTGICK